MSKKIEAEEFDLLGDIENPGVNSTKKTPKKPEGANTDWDIDPNNILVGRLSNANIDWTKLGNKNKFLRMAQEFDSKYEDYIDATPKVKVAKFNQSIKKTMERSTPVDWDRLLNMAIVAKYLEDKELAQRRRDVIHAQRILRDKESTSDDINRAKATIAMNKDIIGVEVQANQNEGLIIKTYSLSAIEEHINREKELSQ